MAQKLSDKLKGLFKRADTYLGKAIDKVPKSTTAMKKALKPTGMMKAVDKLPSVAKFASATKKAGKFGKLKTIGRIASRAALPVAAGVETVSLAYKLATRTPEQKAKTRALKSKLSKTSTKDYHADLMKMSTGGDTMLKGGQKKLDKNKDGKISGEDFEIIKKTSKAQVSDKEAQKVMKRVGGGAATKGMGAVVGGSGLQDEELIPGKSLDYYKDIM